MASLIPERIRSLASEAPTPGLAVFRADGALWRNHLAEDFALWMIGEGLFDGSLWPVYERHRVVSSDDACLQMLRFTRGMPLPRLRLHAEHFWQVNAAPAWILAVRATLQWAHERGLTVAVLSAAPAPVLAPVARHLPVDLVLAAEPACDAEGRCTGEPHGPLPLGNGAAERLRAGSELPVTLAVGHGEEDLAVMRMAGGVAWAIDPDEALAREALRSAWLRN